MFYKIIFFYETMRPMPFTFLSHTYYFSFNWCEKHALYKIGMKRQFLDFSHSVCIAAQTQIQIQSLISWVFSLLLCEAQRTLSTEARGRFIRDNMLHIFARQVGLSNLV